MRDNSGRDKNGSMGGVIYLKLHPIDYAKTGCRGFCSGEK